MSQVRYKQLSQISFTDLEVYSVLPDHLIWSRADELLDFSFADEICAPLYSTRGARPYAPSLKLKLHIVQRYYDLSDREMEERVIGDLFIKRFLGLPVSFMGFDHSTIGLDRDRMGSALFGRLVTELNLKSLTAKLPENPTPEDIAASFSQLVILAYGLLHWFEKESVRALFWSWKAQDRQLALLERQAILYRVLSENTVPDDPNDPDTSHSKRPRKERPTDRLVSSVDLDARASKKRSKSYIGDKIQVVTSATNNIVLEAEPISGNEPDGEQLQELVNAVRQRHDVSPESVVADSAYGYGYHRRELDEQGIQLVAPLHGLLVTITMSTRKQKNLTKRPKQETCLSNVLGLNVKIMN